MIFNFYPFLYLEALQRCVIPSKEKVNFMEGNGREVLFIYLLDLRSLHIFGCMVSLLVKRF